MNDALSWIVARLEALTARTDKLTAELEALVARAVRDAAGDVA
jgi:hypothetical protein